MSVLHFTTSLCRDCKEALPARAVARDGGVWLEKTCPEHGEQSTLTCTSADWYVAQRAYRPRRRPPSELKRAVDLGCPYDCGPCEQHQVPLAMPVVTITSSCNLDCPICYVHNRNEGAYHMSLDDFRSVLRHVREVRGGDLDLINLTGGEPMLHPRFLDLLHLAREEGVRRVTICSNGLKLRDDGLLSKLRELGARVALSFDTFEADVDVAMQGLPLLSTKMRALDLMAKHGVDCTLIPVMTKGYNDHEIGRILDLAVAHPSVRHVEVHTMTYTGQGGVSFDRSGRITLYEVLERIEAQTGWLAVDDFVPSPCAHPLCYQVAYLLLDPDGGPPVPFTRFLGRDGLYESLSEHLYMLPTPRLEHALKDAIDRLWVDESAESERTLRLLKRLLQDSFPPDRALDRESALRASERHVKAVYVHSHMDEESFDVERLAACCDANCYADGRTVPVCAYNVLYREKEANFMRAPKTWGARLGGRRDLSALEAK